MAGISLRFTAESAILGLADLYGFGCADFGTGGGQRLYRGATAVLAAGKGFGPLDDGEVAVYRFTVGCIRPLCDPATESTKGQRFQFGDQGLLAFCFHCLHDYNKKRIYGQERNVLPV